LFAKQLLCSGKGQLKKKLASVILERKSKTKREIPFFVSEANAVLIRAFANCVVAYYILLIIYITD